MYLLKQLLAALVHTQVTKQLIVQNPILLIRRKSILVFNREAYNSYNRKERHKMKIFEKFMKKDYRFLIKEENLLEVIKMIQNSLNEDEEMIMKKLLTILISKLLIVNELDT